VLGAAYTLLFLLGLLGGPFGPLPYLLPLNGLDNVLHIVTAALIAFGADYASRQAPSPAR
jgi:hypothetical protein